MTTLHKNCPWVPMCFWPAQACVIGHIGHRLGHRLYKLHCAWMLQKLACCKELTVKLRMGTTSDAHSVISNITPCPPHLPAVSESKLIEEASLRVLGSTAAATDAIRPRNKVLWPHHMHSLQHSSISALDLLPKTKKLIAGASSAFLSQLATAKVTKNTQH